MPRAPRPTAAANRASLAENGAAAVPGAGIMPVTSQGMKLRFAGDKVTELPGAHFIRRSYNADGELMNEG